MTTENADNKASLPTNSKMSRAEWFALLGAVFGVLPILLCAMRVMIVARGEFNSLRTLVQNLDVKALVLATLLPVGGTVMLWVQFALFMLLVAKDTLQQYKRILGTSFVCLLPFTIAILGIGTPTRQLLINIALLVLLIIALIAANRMRGMLRSLIIWLCAIGMMVGVAAVVGTVVTQSDLWVPFERIALEDGPVVEGYVLSVDEEWTRYMDSSDRSIHIVHTDKVKTRDLIDR